MSYDDLNQTENPETSQVEGVVSDDPQILPVTEPDAEAEVSGAEQDIPAVAEAIEENEAVSTESEIVAETIIDPVAPAAPESQELNLFGESEPAAVEQEAPAQETSPVADAAEVEHHTEEAAADHHKEGRFDAVFAQLQEVKEKNETIEVTVKGRIRGGMRVIYEDMPLFLPASHFSLKRNPTEKEMHDAVGSKISVTIHELQVEENGRKTVIVSRKKLLEDDFWSKLNIGDIVEGTVSSIASFGVFVDIGGMEGLIHISRLSQVHVDDPKNFVKKGQTIRAVIVEADRAKNRIALSRKELEDSPWKNAETDFATGTIHKGIVRRITDFGAYLEMKPGVDGLLRTSELSWTKRIKSPAEMFQPGNTIDIYIMSVSEEKQTMNLSYRRTLPNPWEALKEKYPVGSEFMGKVVQVMPQGAIISLDDDVDGFMPRSKIKPMMMKGKKIPFQPGDPVEVIIADLIPADESLILSPKYEEEAPKLTENAQKKPAMPKRDKPPMSVKSSSDSSGAFTISDILSDKLNNLIDKSEN